MTTEQSHYWIGYFETENDFINFFRERPAFYEDDTTEQHISAFAESQRTPWIDHDFMEYGFEAGDNRLQEKFAGYSYADQWLPELTARLEKQNIDFKVNALVFVTKGKIKKPETIQTEKYRLVYMGSIEYTI